MLETNETKYNGKTPVKVTYATGGNVQASNGIYIAREADKQLLKHCQESRFAYVLATRQIGKSSLMNHTAERLAEEEILSVVVDLSTIGKLSKDEFTWYGNILFEIAQQLEIYEFSYEKWKKEYGSLGATKMFEIFILDVVLRKIGGRVVIFLDEIDSTIDLEFKDDFFATIRYFYQLRANKKEFSRLSFVLIGVATPSDLISDTARTPFNIGERVALADFTLAEAAPLAGGLHLPEENALEVIERVMYWTNGHPYLTLRCCKLIADKKLDWWKTEEIDEFVSNAFLTDQGVKDNLQFVSGMLTADDKIPKNVEQGELLEVYQRIWRGGEVKYDEHSPKKTHLKLSGVVKEVDGQLKVRNKIYYSVFNNNWIKENLPATWAVREYKRIRRNAAILILFLVLLGGIAIYASIQAKLINDVRLETENERKKAVLLKEEADRNREEAVSQAILAKRATELADERAHEAESAQSKAIKARETIELEQLKTKEALNRAIQAEKEAKKAQAQAIIEKERAEKQAETERHYRRAHASFSRSDLGRAAQEFELALIGYESEASYDLEGITDTLTHLGITYEQLQQNVKAEDNYKKALNIYETDQENFENTFWTIERYGLFLGRREKNKAIELYNNAIKKSNKNLEKAWLLHSLGIAYTNNLSNLSEIEKQEEEEKAIENYRKALAIYRESKDANNTLIVLGNIISTYRERFKRQNKHLQQLNNNTSQKLNPELDSSHLVAAVQELVNYYGEKSKESAAEWSKLGETLAESTSKRSEAVKYLTIAKQSYEDLNEKTFVAATLKLLANISQNANNNKDAIEYLVKASDIYKILPSEKYNYARTLESLANYSHLSEKNAEAVAYLRQAQEIYESLPVNRTAFTRTLEKLAVVSENLSDKNKAIEQFDNLKEKYHQEKNYVSEAKMLEKIGNMFSSLNEKTKAIENYKQAGEIYQKPEVNQRYEAARVQRIIAKTYNEIGGRENKLIAIDFYKKALQILDIENSSNSPEYELPDSLQEFGIIPLALIGEVYYSIGEPQMALDYFKKAYLKSQKLEDTHTDLTVYVTVTIIQLFNELREPQMAFKFFDENLVQINDKDKKFSTLTCLFDSYLLLSKQKAYDYLNQTKFIYSLDKSDEQTDALIQMIQEARSNAIFFDQKEKSLKIFNNIYDFLQRENFEKSGKGVLFLLAANFNLLGEKQKGSELFLRVDFDDSKGATSSTNDELFKEETEFSN